VTDWKRMMKGGLEWERMYNTYQAFLAVARGCWGDVQRGDTASRFDLWCRADLYTVAIVSIMGDNHTLIVKEFCEKKKNFFI
jgi:hypothetical protein